ncbi:MAG: alpha/beta hydrolase-fold protein [Chitinophagales bacterium]|nr:esterase family protein [Bacteroidota bacterium]MCB9042503.1 esterase family protein [Chitinophagales bacterium]
MKEQYVKWYSPTLSMDIEMEIVGERGYPVLMFPTSFGRYYQNKDFKLIESARWFVENGFVKFYCIDSVDQYSWYNKKIHPADRVKNHVWYDKMLYHELVPRMQAETGVGRVAVGGCSFGGYHATNFGFRHPDVVKYVFNMGAAFDIKSHLNGYYDDNVYFNNPMDFIPDSWNDYFRDFLVVLGVGEYDFCLDANIRLSELLNRKGIANWLDVVEGGIHDWPAWRWMFPHYLSLLVN